MQNRCSYFKPSNCLQIISMRHKSCLPVYRCVGGIRIYRLYPLQSGKIRSHLNYLHYEELLEAKIVIAQSAGVVEYADYSFREELPT